MSGRIVGEVIRFVPRDLKPTARHVLLCLAEAAHDSDRIARRKSLAVLSWDTGLDESTVKRALADLVKRGLVVRLVDKPGPGTCQEYRLSFLTEEHRRATVGAPRGVNPHP